MMADVATDISAKQESYLLPARAQNLTSQNFTIKFGQDAWKITAEIHILP